MAKRCVSNIFSLFFFGMSIFGALLSLTGCSTVISQMASTAIPSSKYMPAFTSEKAVSDWFELIRSVSGQVVTDELGTYYHKINGDKVEVVFLSKEDGEALRNLLAGDTGLLEPIYKYDASMSLVPDWVATQKRHAFLTNKVRLKLLSLDYTKKLHDALPSFAVQQAKRNSGFVAMTQSAFGGNFGLRNKYYSADVLDKVGGSFNFVLTSPTAEQYFGNDLLMRAMGGGEVPITASVYRSARWQLSLQNTIDIVPRSYFSSLEKGGINRFNSGCTVSRMETALDIIKLNKESSDVPYLSAIAFASKDKSVDEIKRQKSLFEISLASNDSMRLAAEQACVEGLAALQVSGAIRSTRLK